MNKEKHLKDARELCVPTIDLCRQINLPIKPKFYWYHSPKFEQPVLCETPDDDIYGTLRTNAVGKNIVLIGVKQSDLVPAYRFEDIFRCLPKILSNKGIEYELQTSPRHDRIFYSKIRGIGNLFEVQLQDYHFAQMYAQMYVLYSNLNKGGV